jgi:hypothetical protein
MNDAQLIEKVNDRLILFAISDNPHNLKLRDIFYLCSLEELTAYYHHSHIVKDEETIKMLKPIIEMKLQRQSQEKENE